MRIRKTKRYELRDGGSLVASSLTSRIFDVLFEKYWQIKEGDVLYLLAKETSNRGNDVFALRVDEKTICHVGRKMKLGRICGIIGNLLVFR